MGSGRALAVIAGAVVLAAPVAALAASAPAFEFAATSAVELVPGKSAKLALCNGSSGDVQATVLAEGFAFSRAAGFVRAVLSLPAKPVAIAAGGCATFTVTVPAGALQPGTYPGSLVATSAAGIARRALVVSMTPDGDPAPALADVTLEARHYPFSHHASLIGAASLPLGPYEGNVKAVAVKPGRIAVLENGGHRAFLVAPPNADTLKVENGWAQLPVTIEGASKTGTYTGDVAFGDKKMTVHVATGDPIWLCIAAILLGIAVAGAALLCGQLLWPWITLERWGLNLRFDYQDAVDAYNAALEGANGGARPDLPTLEVAVKKLDDYSRSVGKAFIRYRKRTVLVDPNSDEYKPIQEKLDSTDRDLELIRDPEQLLGKLIALRKALEPFLTSEQLEQAPPAFIAGALTLFDEVKYIAVGDATELAASADAYTELASKWPELEQRLALYERWVTQLKVAEPQGEWDPQLPRALHAAESKVKQARYELYSAGDRTAFDRLRGEQHLDEAYALLSSLGWLYHPGDPAPSVGRELFSADSRLQTLDWTGSLLRAGPRWAVRTAREAAASPEIRAATAGAAKTTVGALSVGLILVLAIGGALATGLTTVYSDTFGSLSDYLTAVGLGGTAGVAAKAIVDGIGGLRRFAP
ncbi:MAG TPA: hypothetical protein VIL77_07570 [Gaiellaceae bacterium]